MTHTRVISRHEVGYSDPGFCGSETFPGKYHDYTSKWIAFPSLYKKVKPKFVPVLN
jgi:hypothetical protein